MPAYLYGSNVTATQLNALSASDFQALTPTELASFSNSTIGNIDDTHIAYLSPQQLNGMDTTQLTAFFSALAASKVWKISHSTLNLLSPSVRQAFHSAKYFDWEGGGTNQPAVIASLNLTQLESAASWWMDLSTDEQRTYIPTAISVLLPQQIEFLMGLDGKTYSYLQNPFHFPFDIACHAILPYQMQMQWDWANLPVSFLNNLTQQAFQSIRPDSLAQLSSASIQGLNTVSIGYLTAGQLNGMSASHMAIFLSSLSMSQLSSLSEQTVAALNQTARNALPLSTDISYSATMPLWELAAMTPTQIVQKTKGIEGSLSVDDIKVLSTAQIAELQFPGNLTSNAIAVLTSVQVDALRPTGIFTASSFLNDLSTGGFQGLTSEDLAQLPQATLAGLNASTVGNLSPMQLNGMTAPQLAYFLSNLTVAQFGDLSPQTLQGLNDGVRIQLAAYSTAQVPPTSDTTAQIQSYVQSLPLWEIAAMSPQTVNAWSKDLSSVQHDGIFDASLTADQVSVMSSAQIGALQHPDHLNLQAVAALNATQVAAVSINFSWVSASWLNELSQDGFSGLSGTQLDEMGNSPIKGLDTNHVGYLSTAQLNGSRRFLSLLSTTQLGELSAQQLAGLSDAARIQVTTYSTAKEPLGLNATQMQSYVQNLPLWEIAAMSLETVAAWSGGLSQGLQDGLIVDTLLTAAQVSVMSSAQIGALQHPDQLSPQAIASLNATQVAAISIGLNWMSAQWLNALSQSGFAGISGTQWSELTNSAIQGLDATHIGYLSAAQLNGMSTTQRLAFFQSMTAQLGDLPLQTIQGLSDAVRVQLATKSTAQEPLSSNATQMQSYLQNLPLWEIAAMSPQTVAAWSSGLYQGKLDGLVIDPLLTADQVSVMSSAQIGALQHQDQLSLQAVAALNATQVAAISISFVWMSASWVNALSQDGFAGLSGTQLAQLTNSTIQGLDTIHVGYLNTAQLNGSGMFLAALTTTQLGELSVQQLTGLNPTAISALASSYAAGVTEPTVATVSASFYLQLPLWEIVAMPTATVAKWSRDNVMDAYLSADDISVMSPAQIAALVHPDQLNRQAIATLSTAQVAVIPLDWSAISSDWLNALSFKAFSSLSSNQLSQLNLGATGGIDLAHVGALTSAQIDGMSPSALVMFLSWLSTKQLTELSQTVFDPEVAATL